MAQHDYSIANQTFPNTRTDLNNALSAISSNNSGTSAPSTTFANQFWYDTSTNKFYIRNEDNDANIQLFELDQTNDTVEYFLADSIRTTLIEFTDGDDALTIADGGALTTSGNLSIGGSNNELRFYEGSNFVGFEAPALTGDQIFVLPSADGTANQVLQTDGSGTLSFASVGGDNLRPNVKPLIINGDMAVSQRSTSVASISSTDAYNTVDRIRMAIGTAGTYTQSQATDAPTGSGFVKSLKLDNTTANGSLSAGSFHALHYRFEGQDLQLLKKGTSSAEKVTIAFWVKSAKTGQYTLELEDRDNSRSISQAYTISSANTWEKKVLSFAGDTTGALDNDTSESFRLLFWLAAGSTYQSGTLNTSWAAQNNANRAVGNVNLADSTSNDWYITGLQMEVGEFTSSTIPDFQHEMFDDSLLRCHRYFINGTGDTTLNPTGHIATATTIQATPQMRRTMRVSPTLTANATTFIALVGGSGATTTLAFSNMGRNGFRYGLNTNQTGMTTSQNAAMAGLGADFDSEL